MYSAIVSPILWVVEEMNQELPDGEQNGDDKCAQEHALNAETGSRCFALTIH